MTDEHKSKEQLLSELKDLRRKIKQRQNSNSPVIDRDRTSGNNEYLNRIVVENSPFGISIRNSKGKMLGANESWKKYGASRKIQ